MTDSWARGSNGKDSARRPDASMQTQTRLKFGPELGRYGRKDGRRSVCVDTLGSGFDPNGPKLSKTDEMGRRVGVALMAYKYKHLIYRKKIKI